MHQALEMPDEDRHKRMQKMRAAVAENNIYRWAGKFVSSLLKFEIPESTRPELEAMAQAV
jgi:trehalose-6-phosphate synthase